MYSLTILRLTLSTLVLENTEDFGVRTHEYVLHQLQKREATQSDFDKFNNLTSLDKCIIQINGITSYTLLYIIKIQ